MHTDETTTEGPETFSLYPDRIPALESKIKRLNNRAAKLGMAPVGFVLVGERQVKFTDETGTKRTRILWDIQLTGEAPRLNGYTFLARVEHTPAGNILARAPEVKDEIPADYRDAAAFCDHCQTRRSRKDTFILRTPEGGLMRVGRNCLADYIRSDVAAALAVWTLMGEVRAWSGEDSGGSSFGGRWDTLVEDFVAAAFRAVELDGWVGRTNPNGRQPTASSASFACSPAPTDYHARKLWDEAQPQERDHVLAKEALEWIKAQPASSDYIHNLRVACSLPAVSYRNMGIVASVVPAYKRHLGDVRKAEAPKPVSVHFGKPGARYVRQLTVTDLREIPSDYGMVALYTLQDDQGSVFKWFSSGTYYVTEETPGNPGRSLQVGDRFWFAFGVKKHDTYKGLAQTVITRAGAQEHVESFGFKWVGSDGQVFKTKKDMAA